jgi:hypothetical protein
VTGTAAPDSAGQNLVAAASVTQDGPTPTRRTTRPQPPSPSSHRAGQRPLPHRPRHRLHRRRRHQQHSYRQPAPIRSTASSGAGR